MSKSVKVNYIFNLLLNISKVLFPLITAPYVSRILSADGIGLFNFTSSYASYFALFACLGVTNYGIREIAKRKESIEDSSLFLSQMITIELISTVIVTVFYIGSIFLIGQLNENAILFFITGINLYITPFKVEWFFSGREEFGYITMRSLIIKTISVILLFVVVRSRADLLNYIFLGVFATVASEFWNYIKLYQLGIRPRLTFIGLKPHLKPIFTLFASTIAISIYCMLDTLMLGFMRTYTDVGYYNTAMHIIKTLLPVATSLSAVAMPRVSSYIAKGNIEEINILMNKSVSVVSFLAFPLTMGIILIAPEFVPSFFGEDFYGSILPMQIGCLVIVAIGLNNLNGIQVLIGLGKDKLFLYSVLSGAATNFVLNMLLIPAYGASGAALASVIAETQILFVNEYFVRKYTKVRVTNYRDVLKSIVGTLPFIPICLLLSAFFQSWTFILLAFVLCVGAYLLTEYIIRNNMVVVFLNMAKNKIKH